jgi:hypothetical protein
VSLATDFLGCKYMTPYHKMDTWKGKNSHVCLELFSRNKSIYSIPLFEVFFLFFLEIFLDKKNSETPIFSTCTYIICFNKNISGGLLSFWKRIGLYSNRKGRRSRWFSSSCDMTHSARYRLKTCNFYDFV